MQKQQAINPTCPICKDEYSRETLQKPHSLPICGHSLCYECLHSLIGNLSSLGKKISCPTCRQESTYNGSIANFSVNYSLLDAVDYISELKKLMEREFSDSCPFHNNSLNLLCLDPQCKSQTLNCFQCTVLEHARCQTQFQLELKDEKKKLIFVQYFNDIEAFSKMLEDSIEKYKKLAVEKLNRLYDKFKSEAMQRFRLSTVKDLISNRSLYIVEAKKDESKVKLEVKPANKSNIDFILGSTEVEKFIQEATDLEGFSVLSAALNEFLKLFN
jgi:hypothetical protein